MLRGGVLRGVVEKRRTPSKSVGKRGDMMECRKATPEDLDRVAEIYDRILTEEEAGRVTIGYQRGIYPTRQTAEDALKRDDLFVEMDDDVIVGTGIINQIQMDVYAGAPWAYEAADNEVMVFHTLVIDPRYRGQGYGTGFIRFYESYALEHGCHELRIDTNERNRVARNLYRKLGFREIGIAPCQFNGIDGVRLVLLEKRV